MNWTSCNRADAGACDEHLYCTAADMQFVMTELADPVALSSLPGLEETTPELAEAVLGEAAGHATEVLAPLNKSPATNSAGVCL